VKDMKFCAELLQSIIELKKNDISKRNQINQSFFSVESDADDNSSELDNDSLMSTIEFIISNFEEDTPNKLGLALKKLL
jgi:hypothetical protein